MIAVVVGYVDNDACSAVVAMLPDGKWLVHSINENSLHEMLDLIPPRFKPSRIEGEVQPVQQAIKHNRFKKRPVQYIIDCLHLETSGKITHNPGGLHRLARHSDIPRLNEYAGEFETQKESMPRPNWEMLISENRILLGIVEGTVASVAIRGPATLDRVLIDGVYTFRAFRGRGLAKKLVAALAQQAEGRNQTAAVVVGTKNKPMIALLEELDFHKTADYLIAVFEGEKRKADRLSSE
jgi:GNAT superfamily N-acetyltransferase